MKLTLRKKDARIVLDALNTHKPVHDANDLDAQQRRERIMAKLIRRYPSLIESNGKTKTTRTASK